MTTSVEILDRKSFNNKSNVPLVHYSLFTEDPNPNTTSKSKAVKLEKVAHLLSHPHSATLYERHEIALNKMLTYSKDGFMMRDSVHIGKLICIFCERVTLIPATYLEPFIKVLQLCSIPVLKERSSDKLLYHQIYVDLISQIGYAIRVSNMEVKLQVCKTLYDLFTTPTPTSKYDDLIYNEMSYTKSVIIESDVLETFSQILINLGTDLELTLAVLNLLQLFTKYSKTSCDKMIKANGAHNLYTMAKMDVSNNVLFRTIDIFWNLLEQGDGEMLKKQLSHQNFIEWLRDMFIGQLTKGYSISERQLRNDILIIITLLAQINPEAPFVESGLVKQLVLLATFQEVKSHNPLVKNLKLALNHEDFEMKKLLINVLVVLSENKSVIPFLEDGQFLLALFICVTPTSLSETSKSLSGSSKNSLTNSNKSFFNTNNSVWKPAYQEELQLHALASIATLVPKMINKFQDICGVNRLLIFVEWCIGNEMGFAGYGNAFHAMGGKGNKLAQMRYCMRLILKVVQLNDTDINQEFISEGCISMLTSILGNVLKWEKSNSAIDLEIQCDMLFILAILCERDTHAKEIFGSEGVSVLIGYLKLCYRIGQVSFGHSLTDTASSESKVPIQFDPAEVNTIEKLVVATIDAVWGCINGSYFTEHNFLDQNGAFLILDLLEIIPAQLRSQTLGCLVDLSENLKALNHLKTWRGRILPTTSPSSSNNHIQVNIAHLLCKIWREEEMRLDVERGPYGQLGTDLICPLIHQSTALDSANENEENSDQYSRAILEISESLRANVYSLMSRLGYLDHPGLQIEDHVTITIIESYLEFKMGEVWSEIQNEFIHENVRPISPDVEALEWITRSIEQQGIQVNRVQVDLVEAKNVQDNLDEYEFYNQLRENHRQKEKNLHHFADFVERTSNYEKLKQARQNQLANIDASRIIPPAYLDSGSVVVNHPVGVQNIQVTKFCADTIQVDSTPVDIFGGKLACLEKYGDSNQVRNGSSTRQVVLLPPPL